LIADTLAVASAVLALAAQAPPVPPGPPPALARAAQAPPTPPGPPPGNGLDLPPSPGTAPPFVPPGSAVAIPDTTGPGLAGGGRVTLDRRRRSFAVTLACQANGTLRVRAPRIATGEIGRERYRCASGRATVRVQVSRRIGARLARRGTVALRGAIRQSGQAATVYFELTKRTSRGFWTDGHLQCTPGYLVEPDFTAATPIPISTRGWIAWYTPQSGWRWLGSNGENAGRWNTWTATVSGVAQFHPNGATVPVPWTLGPITVPPGRGIYAVGVYEIVYWVGGRPDHHWQYVNAGTTGAVAAGAGTHYCVYP
jgi:hypothetical protein